MGPNSQKDGQGEQMIEYQDNVGSTDFSSGILWSGLWYPVVWWKPWTWKNSRLGTQALNRGLEEMEDDQL